MFLLAELLGSGFLGIGGFDRLGLVRAHSSIDVAIRVFDVGVFPQLGEVGAEGGLQFLVVESVLNMRKSILQGRDAGLLVLHDFQDDVSLLAVNYASYLAGLQGKCFVLNRLGKLTALEGAEVPAISGRGAVGIFLSDVLEGSAVVNLLEEIVGLGFGSA